MSTNEIIGVAVVTGVPLIVSVMALMRPIINLNTSITELNVTIKQLTKDNDNIHEKISEHIDILSDHDKRIYFLEHKED